MSPEEKISQKVLKLLAKAESTTPEEAEALVEKAQELMQRYAITEAAIAHAKGVATKPEEIVKKTFHFEGRHAKAHATLVHRVAEAGGMRSVQMAAYESRGLYRNAIDVDLIGYESDVEAGEMLITSLLIQSASAANAFARAWKADNPWSHANSVTAEKVSFTYGYASGIGTKLRAARKRAETAVKAERGESSVALAIIDRGKQVDGWVDKQYGRLHSTRSANVRPSGYARGRAAGAAADVGGARLGAKREISR